MIRPTDPAHIAYAETPNEMWWSGSEWVPAARHAPSSAPTMSMDKLVQAFNAVRDARTVRRRAWEKEDLALEEDQHTLKVIMLELLNSNGAKSIATPHGTAYRSEKVRPSAADWNVVYDWIIADPERFEVLEKRLKTTFIRQFMDENDGAIPPGVNVHREFEVSVRRPSGSSDD